MSVRMVFTLVSLLLSGPALSHSIFMSCQQQESAVTCTASYSDRSSAARLPIEVISYADQPIVQGITDPQANFTFALPQEDYYILLDAGPGHVVEVDMQDVTR